MSILVNKFKYETIEYLNKHKYIFEDYNVYIGEYDKDNNWIEIKFNKPINNIKSFIIFCWYKYIFRIIDSNDNDLAYNDYYERFICKLFDTKHEILEEITKIIFPENISYINV